MIASTLPIRLVAGDFGGDDISIQGTSPIRLILRSARVADALADGDDVVSDMYRVSSRQDDDDADIIIQSGLSESHGFVLNPGGSVVADVFGATEPHGVLGTVAPQERDRRRQASVFCARNCDGVCPTIRRNSVLKLDLLTKPASNITSVMGRSVPRSAACAWRTRKPLM